MRAGVRASKSPGTSMQVGSMARLAGNADREQNGGRNPQGTERSSPHVTRRISMGHLASANRRWPSWIPAASCHVARASLLPGTAAATPTSHLAK